LTAIFKFGLPLPIKVLSFFKLIAGAFPLTMGSSLVLTNLVGLTISNAAK
jgi:hypothetical protein